MSRIKLFGLIPRKKGLTPEQFHDHYRHPHGTMGRNLSTMRAYCQSHHIHSDLLAADQSHFEAVAEIWLDNVSDVASFRQEPTLVKYILDDEPLFIDMDNLKFLAADEEVLTSTPDALDDTLHPADAMWSPFKRPISIKILQFIHTDSNPEWFSAQDQSLGQALGAFRHIRCHPHEAIHTEAPPFLGAREIWWPTVSAFKQGVANAPEAFKKLITDVPSATTLLAQAERWM